MQEYWQGLQLSPAEAVSISQQSHTGGVVFEKSSVSRNQ